ncbi:alpha-amylase family glycosyl hydrolase [Oceanobacillus chungangensis]|uniref:Alpha-amlyase n=1 Tax=Oceanobacillus chungangensis TaxID=1229152 RepID=A0A3D8PV78_9BACI|nr:alpha-amylase family glycosyl hydrolase [Oceanobacillus chungangensis]RDW19934.1 alpha-amlyase [Oceanobacillus chungangensis]
MKRILFVVIIGLCLFINNENVVFAEGQPIHEEIIYNILIDRYNNGDFQRDGQVDIDNPTSYHGGDLQGIIAKLDDLEEIGVTIISLSPIMENAENGFHGYWIEDFYSIEEQFGTMDDLHQLINEAHDRDIKVVLEFVTNFVASSHPILEDPEKADWIVESSETSPEWMGNVDKLNLENPEVTAYLMEVAEYWMEETDLDGFRLQAVDQVPTDFVEQFTTRIKELQPDFYILGDILETDDNNGELISGTKLEAIENKTLYHSMSDVFAKPDQSVEAIYNAWKNSGKQDGLLYIDDFYGERFTQKFADNGRNALTAWTLALTYMYTSPGTPTLLQGTELPMYGGSAEESQRLVPFNSGDSELKEFHNRISSLRSQFPVLQHGDFALVGSSDSMSVFKRTLGDETMYIAINNGSESAYVDIDGIDSGMQLTGYLGDNLVRENENGTYRVGLARETAEVYSIGPDTGINWSFIGFVGGIFLLFVVGVIYLSRKAKKSE